MNRRTFLAGSATVGTVALAGCAVTEIGAMGDSVQAEVTGHVLRPRSIILYNGDDVTHTVTLAVTDESNQPVFEGEAEIAPDTIIKDVWTTTRVGRYRITARTTSGLSDSTEMLVCVGYGGVMIRIYPDSLSMPQSHHDPKVAHCRL